MSWIQTYTGKQFFPLEPKAEQIDIKDIAHALAMKCRFNGHCEEFYSVAEHSVRVSWMLDRYGSVELCLQGLMHDAAEAYLPDMPKPVKETIPGYRDAEYRIMSVVAEVYGFEFPCDDKVKFADETLLATEARDLMKIPLNRWKPLPEPLAEKIRPLPWKDARALFQCRFTALASGGCGNVG